MRYTKKELYALQDPMNRTLAKMGAKRGILITSRNDYYVIDSRPLSSDGTIDVTRDHANIDAGLTVREAYTAIQVCFDILALLEDGEKTR